MSEKKAKPKTDYIVRMLTIGNKNVGKTCLIKRHFENTFSGDNLATTGVTQKIKYLDIENKSVKL